MTWLPPEASRLPSAIASERSQFDRSALVMSAFRRFDLRNVVSDTEASAVGTPKA